jgi:hypothetical protein
LSALLLFASFDLFWSMSLLLVLFLALLLFNVVSSVSPSIGVAVVAALRELRHLLPEN